MQFMRALVDTSDLTIFDSSFIQRYINYQWDSRLSYALYYQLITHVFCCVLIIMNINLLDGHRGETAARVRFWSSVVLSVTILLTVFLYEIK